MDGSVRFVTPGSTLAVVAVTAAGLIQAGGASLAAGSGARLALLVALGAAHALLGTAGLYVVERRGGSWRLRLHFATAVAVGFLLLAVGRGSASLTLMSLISQGVLYLSPAGAALVTGALALATLGMKLVYAPTVVRAIGPFVDWSAAAAFVIVFSRMLAQHHRARTDVERLARELGEANAQLRARAGDVAELATARERNRIAREIHDGLGHYLTAAHMQLEAAQATLAQTPDSARQSLLKAQELTREGLGDIRRSVALLRGTPGLPSLFSAMERLAAECTAAGLAAEARLAGAPRPLAEPVEHALYRAAQEALTNVRRHARASRLTIELAYRTDETVHLSVEDDGVGSPQVQRGFGLLGLGERAELVGGKLAIQTAPGRGFRLEVEVPG
jgi:signal transduction histidine kinase